MSEGNGADRGPNPGGADASGADAGEGSPRSEHQTDRERELVPQRGSKPDSVMTVAAQRLSSLHFGDVALVERAIAGEESAFDEIADSHFAALYRFALGRLDGNRDLARDIVQTTLCKVMQKLHTFRGHASLFTWLCACCRNEIGMHFRRVNRAPEQVELDDSRTSEGQALPFLPAPTGPDGQLLSKETAKRVHLALDLLPDHYKRALVWKYLDRQPVVEIAARLELRPKAAESVLTRARKTFREIYERLEREGSSGHRDGGLQGEELRS